LTLDSVVLIVVLIVVGRSICF